MSHYPTFDCGEVCTYYSLRKRKGPAGQERKALSRLGTLFRYWILNIKRLFHMLIGLAFMFLTAAGASVTYSEWQFYRKAPELGVFHFSLVGAFTVLLAILCLYSFVKARSVR